MKTLTITMTNENYRLLEYALNGRFGRRSKIENRAAAVLLQFVADEARKDLAKLGIVFEKEPTPGRYPCTCGTNSDNPTIHREDCPYYTPF